MLELNNLFDDKYYLLHNQDVANAISQGVFSSGFDHFQKIGQFEGRSPSGFFSEDYYLSQNKDVAQAVQSGIFQNGLEHFINYGQFEKRQASVFFAPSFYSGLNSDVNTAVANGLMTAIEHFVKYGQFEKRDPINEFYTTDYLTGNPDIAQAVQATANTADSLTAIEHFIDYGQYELRSFGPDFNNAYYLQQNPDVAAAVKPYGLSPIEHYLQFGKNEERLGSETAQASLSRAVNLDLMGTTNLNGFVGDTSSRQIYGFTVSSLSLLNATLNNLTADADLYLIQDKNNNGLVDDTEETSDIITASQVEGNAPESILQLLQPGTYFVAVEPFESNTNFNLSLSATPYTLPPDTAGNTLSTARNLGPIPPTQTVSEFVGSTDEDDFYQFNLATRSRLNGILDNLSADVDLYLIKDINGNGVVEDSEIIDVSGSPDTTPEEIFSPPLPPGNYFIYVQQFEGDTVYKLNLSAEPA